VLLGVTVSTTNKPTNRIFFLLTVTVTHYKTRISAPNDQKILSDI
jgi:hypothetical protein